MTFIPRYRPPQNPLPSLVARLQRAFILRGQGLLVEVVSIPIGRLQTEIEALEDTFQTLVSIPHRETTNATTFHWLGLPEERFHPS